MMVSWIKDNKGALIWCLIYLFFVYTAYQTSMIQQELYFEEFLKGNLFTLQKYFFDISIFFVMYLYTMKKPFHSVFFVSRCKESHLLYVLLYGLKICLFYIGYTAILFILFPLIGGFSIQLTSEFFFNFMNLFSFLFTTYLVYVIFLLLSGRQMLAVLSGFAINSTTLMILLTFGMISESLSLEVEVFLLNSYTGIAIVLLCIIFMIFRRRDFLL